jgi:membrane protein DedA with SNARE-associated domain
MTALVDRILIVPGAVVYVLAGLLVFAEDALFVGFVLPGETAAVLAGVAASRHHVSLPLTILVVAVAAVVGDTVGYEIGRHAGGRVLRGRMLDRHAERVQAAQDFLARRGAVAVFLGRFVAFFRAVMPALAGTAGMPYRRFLVANAAGGIAWAAGTVLLGYLAANSYRSVERVAGRTAALVALGIVLVLLAGWRIRRRRRRPPVAARDDG